MSEKYPFLTFMNKLRYSNPLPPPCNRSFCFSFQPEITVQDLHFIRFGTWPNCQCSILRKHFYLFFQVKQRKFISCINFVDLVTRFSFYLSWPDCQFMKFQDSRFQDWLFDSMNSTLRMSYFKEAFQLVFIVTI